MTKLKIVLVGDISPTWQTFQEALEAAGYVVWTAEGAADALMCLERVSPHLMIFTAVAARDYDVIRTLHAAAPNLDVLVANQSGDNAAIDKALQVGVDDFIFPPDTPLMLAHDLRRVVEHTSEMAQVNQRLRRVMIERAQTEEQLRKLSRAVEQSPSATVITDLDARIEYVNPKFTEVTGYTLEEVYGQNPRVLRAEENPPEIYDALWAALKAGEEWRGEWLNRRKDGSLYWEFASVSPLKDAEGRVTHYIKVAENITARKRAEAKLRQSEANFKALMNATRDIALLIDVEGQVLAVNQTLFERLHTTPGDIVGTTIYDWFPPALARARRTRVQEVVASGEMLRYEETAPDGEVTYNSIYPIFDDAGQVARLAIFVQDITALKQAEARLREYAEHLARMVDEKVHELDRERAKVIQAGKMASLGEMATGVAHELNQPLTSMTFDIEYLQRLAERGTEGNEVRIPTAELQEIVEGLRGDVARSRRITDHLRTFGRAAAGDVGDVDLNQVIQDSFILIGERLYQHNVHVERDLAPDLPPLRADAFKLEQVFLNLISNAEHAMARRAAQESGEYKKRLDISTRVEDAAIVARVRDNGTGISPAEQARIFEPFFTTKPVGEGTGLGLSISRDIVTECGGELTFESVAGEGTTFVLRFNLDMIPNV